MVRQSVGCIVVLLLTVTSSVWAHEIDLSKAIVVTRGGELPAAERIAPTVLVEELQRRTGIQLPVTTEWPVDATAVIAISTRVAPPSWSERTHSVVATVPEPAESFSIRLTPANEQGPAIVFVTGRDSRGALFGVGKLLRNLNWHDGRITLSSEFQASESPDRPLRGHQLGYRDTANSWDAWRIDQFDQYFRELVIFGANAVENIPWQGGKLSPLMKYSRPEMNIKFAELCDRYDLDHWIWVPVLVKLPNATEEAAFLEQQEAYYQQVKRLDAIFVPGGDPGDNKAEHLVPFLQRMASLVNKYHPQAKVWLSLQHFKPDDVDFLFHYLDEHKPVWFGGLVMGPGSPPMEATRRRLADAYQLRWYPDITHTVRCQYPVPWLDPALGMTLGRECVNPRPVDYTAVYRMDYSFTNGFLSYSDGVHDDFNKNLWSQLGWNPEVDPRRVAEEYARFFFRSDLAQVGADGLFSLETNLRGALAENGSIEGALRLWQELERGIVTAGSPWRFQMHLFRAYYDAYTRKRLLYETDLERQALAKLAESSHSDVLSTISAARQILERAATEPVDVEGLEKLNKFGETLFEEIGLQTSVPRYQASGYERGAVLDFVNYPLNNRWWLEDQLEAVVRLSDVATQRKRIEVIINWENPGDQGYYDVVGHVGRSPRIPKLLLAGDALRHQDDHPRPNQRWVGEKRNRLRQAWHAYLFRIPQGITYNNLDSSSAYIVKLFAQRSSPLVIDGVKAKLLRTGETFDQVTEQIFEVPAETLADGRITLTWEEMDESELNWRQRHYVTDIWVIKAEKQ
ncbi:hypothetical protein [Schlesneria sp.]|uniref:hypothetical protein n=1 Tax=Schlesneria sp. TaxID=2762018 RepID=UPI002EEF990A